MDWKLGRQATACRSCEKAFEPEAIYFTVLLEQNEEFERIDMCPDCFAVREAPPDDFFWKGRRPAPQGEQERRVDFNAVKAFLRKSRNETSIAYHRLNYVLALILVRKKMLRMKEMVSRGRDDFMKVQFTKEDEVFEIPVPQLTEKDVAEVQANLMDLFRQHAALDPNEDEDAEGEAAEVEGSTEEIPPDDELIEEEAEEPNVSTVP
ncbi:MAG: hypothetical protein RL885_23110 [Planctomycetota bacterium]